MKKCIGCGVLLQNDNPEASGYALNSDQEYCQRCFRLIHYGDSNKLKKENVTNKDVLNIYKEYADDLFVVIVEVFDALVLDLDDLLDNYKNSKIILVVNKIDLLPYNVNDDKLEKLIVKAIRKCDNANIVNCLITYNKDPYFNDLFYKTLDESGAKRVVFAGRVNAGKSTVINKLCKDTKLTTSTYPGTTIKENIIDNGDYTFIDTPGLNDEESFVNWIDKDLIKKLIPLKTIKSKTFQCYDDEAYSVEGLVSIEVLPKRNVSISFYVNNNLDIHRTKFENSDLYLEKHAKEYELNLLPMNVNKYTVNKKGMFYLKGLGYIKINGDCEVFIKVNKKIKIYKCEVEL